MTKGWSLLLLSGAVCVLIARVALHVGGFWDWAPLRDIEDRAPLVAQLLSFESVKRRRERIAPELYPMLAPLDLVVRAVMLVGAAMFGLLGVLLVVSAFFGGPIPSS